MSSPAARSRSSTLTVLEAVGLTLLAFVISIAAGVVFLVPLVALGYDITTTWPLVGSTAAGQVGFLVVALAFVSRRSVDVEVAVPAVRDLLYVVVGTVVALVAATGLSYLMVLADLVPESVIGEAATADPTFLLALAALSVVLVAPAEELLFRGAIQGRLRERYGPVPAVVVASLLFGSLHLANYSGSIQRVAAGALLISAIGAVFGVVYERTRNLAVPIAVHALYNTVLLVTSYYSGAY
jgi:membrane protease YdiL (CAAX protease family)